MYAWPLDDPDCIMHESLDIAMDYLIRTGQAAKFREVQSKAADTIVHARQAGVCNRLRLVNLAISAVEREL
jgi:hypothetical protein